MTLILKEDFKEQMKIELGVDEEIVSEISVQGEGSKVSGMRYYDRESVLDAEALRCLLSLTPNNGEEKEVHNEVGTPVCYPVDVYIVRNIKTNKYYVRYNYPDQTKLGDITHIRNKIPGDHTIIPIEGKKPNSNPLLCYDTNLFIDYKDRSIVEGIELLVDLNYKWRSLYLRYNETIYEFTPNIDEVGYNTDCWDPIDVYNFCEKYDIKLDPLTYELLLGRWVSDGHHIDLEKV